jgi:hypothetical protein
MVFAFSAPDEQALSKKRTTDTIALPCGNGSGHPNTFEPRLMSDPIYLMAVLGAIVAIAEWLGRRPAGNWLGVAIITLILGILLATVGVIPTITNAPPLYGYLVTVGAPVAIFLLLLDVHLGALKRAGLPMLAAFGIGSAGTIIGILTAFWLTDADAWLGRYAAPVGGMYAATYIGGSPNLIDRGCAPLRGNRRAGAVRRCERRRWHRRHALARCAAHGSPAAGHPRRQPRQRDRHIRRVFGGLVATIRAVADERHVGSHRRALHEWVAATVRNSDSHRSA